jgi:hypothetical protein
MPPKLHTHDVTANIQALRVVGVFIKKVVVLWVTVVVLKVDVQEVHSVAHCMLIILVARQ